MMNWLIENAIAAAILAVAAFGLCRLFRRRPAVCHVIWAVVVVRLVLPPLPFAMPVSTAMQPLVLATRNWLGPGDQGFPSHPVLGPESPHGDYFSRSNQAKRLENVNASAMGNYAASINIAAKNAANNEESAPLKTVGGVPSELGLISVPLTVPFLVLLIWVVGSMGVLAVQLKRMKQFLRAKRLAQPATGELQHQVGQMAGKMGVQTPGILMFGGIGTPFVWGLGKPLLCWPAWRIGQTDDDCSRALMVHELAHLRRKDHWMAWFETLAMVVFWWHPLFWLARTQMRFYAELACDAWAMQLFPSRRKAYATEIVDAVDRISMVRPAIAVLGMASSRRYFERRLMMIMRKGTRPSMPRWGIAAAAAFLLIGLPSISKVSSLDLPTLHGLDSKVEQVVMGRAAHQAGDRLVDEDRFAEAADYYRKALGYLKNDAHLQRDLAKALLDAGQGKEALRVLHDLAKQPDAHKYQIDMHLARAYALQGQHKNAMEHLQKAVYSGHMDWDYLLDRDFRALEDRDDYNRLLKDSLKLRKLHKGWNQHGRHDRDDRAGNLKAIEDLVEQVPGSPLAWRQYGYALLRAERYADALVAFKTQSELEPDEATPLYNAACAAARAGETDTALAYLKRAIALGWDDFNHMDSDPDLASIRNTKGYRTLADQLFLEDSLCLKIKSAMKNDDYEAALNYVEKAMDLDSLNDKDRAWLADQKGFAYYHLGRYLEAADAFREQVLKSPHSGVDRPLYNLACSKALGGDVQGALNYLEAAIYAGYTNAKHIQRDDDFRSLWEMDAFKDLVDLAGRQGLMDKFGISEWESFRQEMQNKLQDSRVSGRGLGKTASMLYSAGQWDLAAEAYAKLFEQSKRGADAYNAACCFSLDGDVEQALIWLQKGADAGYTSWRHMKRDDDLNNLRQDSRFQKFLQDLRDK